jgi:hypothetical protein
MNAELEAIKDRIRKLSAVTLENGSSEAEVIKACEVVGKLLQKHNLTMSEVELRQEEFVQKQIWAGGVQRGGSFFALMGIAKFTETKVWTSRIKGAGLYYVFFGQQSDVDMAEYLFKMIDRSIESETHKFKGSHLYYMAKSKKGASTSFSTGMGQRISERLKAMHTANQKEQFDAQKGGALIVLKNQLLQEAYAKVSADHSTTKIKANITKEAYAAGRVAGERVNLSRPIAGRAGEAPKRLAAA